MNVIANNTKFRSFDPDVIQGKHVHALYAYWLGRMSNGKLPFADETDILDLEDLIGLVSIIDVIDSSPRFALRMVGSEVVHRAGQDNTGKSIEEIEDRTVGDILQSSYTEVFKTREPFWVKRESIIDGQLFVYECLIVPFTNPDGDITQLLSIVEYPSEMG